MSEEVTNSAVGRKQILGAVAVVGVIFAILGLIGYGWRSVTSVTAQNQPKDIKIGSAGEYSRTDQAFWKKYNTDISDFEKRLGDLEKGTADKLAKADYIKEQQDQAKRIKELETALADAKTTYEGALKEVGDKNTQLQQQLDGMSAGQGRPLGPINRPGAGYGNLPPTAPLFQPGNRAAAQSLVNDGALNGKVTGQQVGEVDDGRPHPTVVKLNLNGADRRRAAVLHDPKDYVAAGSYVPVKVIVGVDATTGVTEQADPRPMLARVEGKATQVIDDGKFIETDLNGCVVILEGRGDLSSERVYGRPLVMSCPGPGGKVREVRVQGFLVDRGTSGVRGTVTERTGDLVQGAILGGLLQGLGTTVSSALSPNNGGFVFNNQNEGAMTKLRQSGYGGLGGGAKSVGDKLGDYYINRLEQIQPVISAPPGAHLELVFSQGFYLDGRSSSEAAGAEAASAPKGQAIDNLAGLSPAVQQLLAAGGNKK
ncbi:TrbI/VirB10 family protein [Nitrospirillum amazonense]|uniref:TrbI/VirB10 family protein n=1 Tax=Nitrospirillum amazonense TaxID=28077 RepID=UPI0024121F9A|nr:TrbI/VirB10 family protein [Nitrospirillum amazonense]MDG3444534.1 TrbI/VirB10 family protein [Nitrospirillum amazonense]